MATSRTEECEAVALTYLAFIVNTPPVTIGRKSISAPVIERGPFATWPPRMGRIDLINENNRGACRDRSTWYDELKCAILEPHIASFANSRCPIRCATTGLVPSCDIEVGQVAGVGRSRRGVGEVLNVGEWEVGVIIALQLVSARAALCSQRGCIRNGNIRERSCEEEEDVGYHCKSRLGIQEQGRQLGSWLHRTRGCLI